MSFYYLNFLVELLPKSSVGELHIEGPIHTATPQMLPNQRQLIETVVVLKEFWPHIHIQPQLPLTDYVLHHHHDIKRVVVELLKGFSEFPKWPI